MQLISTQTSTGSSNSLTASSIPSTFNHLLVVFYGRSDYATSFPSSVGLQFNGDTAGNYSYQIQTAINTTLAASSAVTQTSLAVAAIPNDNGGVASYPGQFVIDIINYKNTSFFKSAACCQGWTTATAAQGSYRNFGGSWANTAAINSVTLLELSGGNFKNGSTMWVYGY